METKKEKRIRRHARVRAKISGTADRPRLAVFKSNRYLSAQLIDDTSGTTLLAATSKGQKVSMRVAAKAVGEKIAGDAKAKGITTAVFDRGGFSYTGAVKELADGARAGGLKF